MDPEDEYCPMYICLEPLVIDRETRALSEYSKDDFVPRFVTIVQCDVGTPVADASALKVPEVQSIIVSAPAATPQGDVPTSPVDGSCTRDV